MKIRVVIGGKMKCHSNVVVFQLVMFSLSIILIASGGCMEQRNGLVQQAATQYDLFLQVQEGMMRTEVENILGKPIIELDDGIYYLSHIVLRKIDSPSNWGDVRIQYVADKVVEKEYLGHYRPPTNKDKQ